MNPAATSGPFASAHAARRGLVPAASSIVTVANTLVVVRDLVVVVVLPVVGLLLALVLITAGCGPPN
jgi:hypothetical protein